MIDQPTQFLTFAVAGEEYGVDILHVREIVQIEPLTRVPQVPSAVRGVMSLRGSVVAVVDLAVKLGLEPSPITKWTCVVVVEARVGGEPTTLGVMADSVSHVIDLKPAEVLPSPRFGTRVRPEFLHGMGASGKRFVLLLDIDKVLSVDDLCPPDEPEGEAVAEVGEQEAAGP